MTYMSPGYTRDMRTPRERYIAGVLDHIVEEAELTKPPYMTLGEAVLTLIDERHERGILDRCERSEARELWASRA